MKTACLIDLTVLSDYVKQLIPLGLFVALAIAVGMGTIVAVPSIIIMMFAMMGATSAAGYDDLNKWGVNRLTLPLSRRDVVAGRYLTALAIIFLGAVLAMVTLGVLWVVARAGVLPGELQQAVSMTEGDVLGMICALGVSFAVAILIPSVNIPLYFKFGTTKITQVLPFVMLAATCFGVAAFGTLSESAGDAIRSATVWASDPGNLGFVIAGVLAVSAAMLAASAAIATRLYATRDL